ERDGDARLPQRHPGARRLRLHDRVRRRTLLSRREDLRNRRGNLRDPTPGHLPEHSGQDMRKVHAALFLAALLGCGKADPPADPLETEQYRAWKGGQVMRRLPAANFAATTPGRVEIFPPESRTQTPGDFCELYVNGERVGRFNTGKLPDGSFPRN